MAEKPARNNSDALTINVICPIIDKLLVLDGSYLTDGKNCYVIGRVPMLFVDEEAGAAARQSQQAVVIHKVQDFYVDAPFPNYNSFDNIASFVRSADKSLFAQLLRNQLPINANILEVGCGTGQLCNYLAATTLSSVCATDMTPASLRLGYEFARRDDIEGVRFLQMNLFMPCLLPESMDVVISNGVLHHPYETKKAFMSIAPLVKPGGYIIIGLYNHTKPLASGCCF
jgi:SAM-dependent methyltransferase